MTPGEDQPRPYWTCPDDVLAAIVPAGRFLIRTGQMIIALSHVAVYPSGCMFNLHLSARGGGVRTDAGDGFDQFVFTARFGTGMTTVMDTEEPFRRRSRGEDVPLLIRHGYQASYTMTTEQDRKADGAISLWLYPLPPPEPGMLSIATPDLGPDLTGCALDGRAIVVAAARAQPYWP